MNPNSLLRQYLAVDRYALVGERYLPLSGNQQSRLPMPA
jgi:hypothetical protein